MATSNFFTTRTLGRSELKVGPLGFGSSYGAPASAYEMAFERGQNYFYWGSYRTKAMRDAIRVLAPRHREKLVVTLQTYTRWGAFIKRTTESGLKKLRIDYADVLLLGWYNKMPSESVMNAALELKEKKLIRKIAISCHDRPMFKTFISDPRFDVIMVRYNAAHRGAEREVFPHLDSPGLKRPGVITYTTTRWGCLVDPKYTPPGDKTPSAGDCYRFALSNPNVNMCLSGPSTDAQMEANLKALERGPLSDEEMAWMKRVGDHVHQMTAKRVWWNPFMQRKQ